MNASTRGTCIVTHGTVTPNATIRSEAEVIARRRCPCDAVRFESKNLGSVDTSSVTIHALFG